MKSLNNRKATNISSSRPSFFQKQDRALEIINEIFQENILNLRQRELLQNFAEHISRFKSFEIQAIQ